MNRLLSLSVTCLVSVFANAAEVELLRFDPPVVPRGENATIRGKGKFPQWPVQIVVDRADVQVTTDSEEGSFLVNSTKESSPGPLWIRVHDSVSASSLIPVWVATTSVTPEVEPNQSLSTATQVALPTTIHGRLHKQGELDTFRVAVKPGRHLVASVIAHQWLRSPMDAIIQLVDAKGNVLLQNDDERGLDPQIVYMPAIEEEVYLRVMAFPETPNSTIGYAGGDSFAYLLEVTQDPYVDHWLPLVDSESKPIEPVPFGWNLLPQPVVRRYLKSSIAASRVAMESALGWQFQSTQSRDLLHVSDETPMQSDVSPPCVLSGHVSNDQFDRFRLTVVKDQRYLATAIARSWGLATDTDLRVVKPSDNKELARNDDVANGNYDSAVEFTAPESGIVELRVSDIVSQFGPRHAYSVLVEPVVPNVTLTLATDRLRLQAGGSLDIPVTIKRLGGFDKAISIAVIDLPPGVTTEAVRSEPKGDAAKSVTLKLTAAASTTFQGTIRIVGHEIDASGQPVGKPFAATHELLPNVSIETSWLTVFPP